MLAKFVKLVRNSPKHQAILPNKIAQGPHSGILGTLRVGLPGSRNPRRWYGHHCHGLSHRLPVSRRLCRHFKISQWTCAWAGASVSAYGSPHTVPRRPGPVLLETHKSALCDFSACSTWRFTSPCLKKSFGSRRLAYFENQARNGSRVCVVLCL